MRGKSHQKTYVYQTLQLMASVYTPFFPDQGQIWHESGPMLYYTMPDFTLIGKYCAPFGLWGQKLQI